MIKNNKDNKKMMTFKGPYNITKKWNNGAIKLKIREN